MLIRLINKYSFSLNTLPSYQLALNHYLNRNFQLCESYLLETKNQIENPTQLVDLLTMLSEVQSHLQNPMNLLSTREELFFTSLSINTIYNEPQQQALRNLVKSYWQFSLPTRFKAIISLLEDVQVPLIYQNEITLMKGIQTIFEDDIKQAINLFNSAIESGLKNKPLAISQNNLAFAQVNNQELNTAQFNYTEALMNLEMNTINTQLANPEEAKGTRELQTLSLNTLVELTNKSTFDVKTASRHMDRLRIHDPQSMKIVANLIDCLQKQGEFAKSMSWIQVAIKASQQDEKFAEVGRTLLYLATAEIMQGKKEFGEKVILDVLNSNEGESYIQMLALQQYSDMLRLQQRTYEADEYLEQAVNISTKLPKSAHYFEYILML